MNPDQKNFDGGTPEKNSSDNSSHHSAPENNTIWRGTTPNLPPEGAVKQFSGEWGSLVFYLLVTLAAALFVRFFIATPYIVQGASMIPTFDNYHYLIIDRVSYRFEEPQRGDVIVFDMPGDADRALIKRIVGLPGETIKLSGVQPEVTVINSDHPTGFILTEEYLDEQNFGGATNMEIELKDDQYFVLGDNRRVSADSRIWGALPKANIVGRAFFRLFPFGDISVLPGEERYNVK